MSADPPGACRSARGKGLHLADPQTVLFLPEIRDAHPLHPEHRDAEQTIGQQIEIDDAHPGGDGVHVAQRVGLAGVQHAERELPLPGLGDHALVSGLEDAQRHDAARQQVSGEWKQYQCHGNHPPTASSKDTTATGSGIIQIESV